MARLHFILRHTKNVSISLQTDKPLRLLCHSWYLRPVTNVKLENSFSRLGPSVTSIYHISHLWSGKSVVAINHTSHQMIYMRMQWNVSHKTSFSGGSSFNLSSARTIYIQDVKLATTLHIVVLRRDGTRPSAGKAMATKLYMFLW